MLVRNLNDFEDYQLKVEYIFIVNLQIFFANGADLFFSGMMGTFNFRTVPQPLPIQHFLRST